MKTRRRTALAATITLAGALATAALTASTAAAEPYPWHDQSDDPTRTTVDLNKAQIEYVERLQSEYREPLTGIRTDSWQPAFTKAQVEYWERVAPEAPDLTKAQIEHRERAASRGLDRDRPSGSSTRELAGFGAIGLVGLAFAGAGVLPGRRVR